MKLNGATIGLNHYEPAHTDSDICVIFGEADILHVGGHVLERHLSVYRLFDRRQHRRHDPAADANLAATTDKTIIIPGHGQPVSNNAQLEEFRDMLVGIRENVAALKKQGRSLEETIKAKPTAAFDAKFGNFAIDAGFFTRLVFEGV